MLGIISVIYKMLRKFNKNSKKDRHNNNQKLKEINKKLNKISDLLEKIIETPVEITIHLEHPTIEHLQFEELTFDLKNIEVEKLKGHLNIGINYCGHESEKIKKKDKEKHSIIKGNQGKKKLKRANNIVLVDKNKTKV